MTNQSLTAHASAAPATSLYTKLIATRSDPAVTIARMTLALVMLPHGAQKLLGWFGGYGWEGTMQFMTGYIGLPAALAVGLILLESIGSVLLLFGFLTRPIALGFVGIMLGAIFSVHAQFGFFMNWSGDQKGEGFEYHLLVIALAVVLAIRGGGALSVDRLLAGTKSS